MPYPVYWIFYLTVVITSIDLLEEVILVIVLPDYRTNVKGLYWILTRRAAKETKLVKQVEGK